jgi:cysteine desulfurase/selenocysteine lyase
LRPLEVQQSLTEYYQQYPACGGRVKYAWGNKVDSEVEATREKVLSFIKASAKTYSVSFTLNTTYGINLVLQQLPSTYDSIVTTDIEHNSVFVSTISAAKRLGIPRHVIRRNPDGSLPVADLPSGKIILVANIASNIDGRELSNAKEVIERVHKAGGIVIVDAAQAMAHRRKLLHGLDFDVVCFSAHKMYSASLGVIVARKSLIDTMNLSYTGGGMVQDVTLDDYVLTEGDYASRFEPGLQAFGEILALGRAIDWLENMPQKSMDKLHHYAEVLEAGLKSIASLTVYSNGSTVISVSSNKIDAHRLATFLSAQGIMVRSGYFCCHYYLLHQQKTPPLLRFSLGLHTNESDVEKIISVMKKLCT